MVGKEMQLDLLFLLSQSFWIYLLWVWKQQHFPCVGRIDLCLSSFITLVLLLGLFVVADMLLCKHLFALPPEYDLPRHLDSLIETSAVPVVSSVCGSVIDKCWRSSSCRDWGRIALLAPCPSSNPFLAGAPATPGIRKGWGVGAGGEHGVLRDSINVSDSGKGNSLSAHFMMLKNHAAI
jgi:hypothetical protein